MNDQATVPKTTERLLAAWHRRGMVAKVLSFGVIGVANTVVDFGVFWTSYTYFGVPLVAANVFAWLVAVSASYVMNSVITFARESGRELRWRQYVAFVAAGVPGVIANTTALWLASRVLPVLAAKIIAIGVSFVVNFSLSHFVVFRPRPKTSEETSRV